MSAIQRVVDRGDLADAGKATWPVLHCGDQGKGQGDAVTGTVEANLLDASANSTPGGTNREVVVGIRSRNVAVEVENPLFTVDELCLRDVDGVVISGNGRRWLGQTTAADELLLDRAVAPVLDIGCGPGRHLLALARRGVAALGLDVTPSAVRLARSRGATVLQRSIFEPVAKSGTWSTALLLDGNIGIGGDPRALLARVSAVIRPGGRILTELGPPDVADVSGRARVDHHGCLGPWFNWATVGAASLEAIAAAAGMQVSHTWRIGERWFAEIETATTPPLAQVVPQQ
ncbi:MAG: class I SAM-dependent methyltransferase [Actinomycetota bacterium]|nr:class I SAM-dependent methyltransferase [Actinomycetota bacterium]